MGRKLKYLTVEEQRMARNKRSLGFYYRNQEKCKKKRMDRYYAKINNK
jgi:hypothetical protein